MTTDPIQFMLARIFPGDEHTRPFAMEALIRGGSRRADVTKAFRPSGEELSKLDDLLARPPIDGA